MSNSRVNWVKFYSRNSIRQADIYPGRTNIANMDIFNINQTSSQVTSQPNNSNDILDSLRRLGGTDATVIRIAKGEVLLATRLGEIIGKNVLDLKTGDQVRIRVGGQVSNPVLKVSLPSADRLILNSSRQAALPQALAPNQPQTAIVTTQGSESTGIILNDKQYSITRQATLKTGQLISLIYRPGKSQIEIKPIDTEQVLRSALTRLFPQAMRAGSDQSLVSLVKAFQSMISPPPTAQAVGQAPISSIQYNPGLRVTAALNSTPFEQGGAQAQLITRFLSMLQSLPDISTLDRIVIQQWVGFIGSIRNIQGTGKSTLENPFSLLKQLPTNETYLRPLLQQWARQISNSPQLTAHSASNKNSPDTESYSNFARDILKLVEQSLSQHQFQQTSMRYQQELQQPINLSLSIPVTEDQSTRPLHINIRQRKSSVANEDNAWDVILSFEFGLLGLISSHINLDGNTMSTTFWASQEDTRLMIDHALPEFRQQLLASGFELGKFSSLPGPAPETKEHTNPYYPDSLLDIKV